MPDHNKKRILLISNGHGEDLLGGVLAQALYQRTQELDILAFPVVGKGDVYRRFPVEIVGVQKEMPSGGWVRQSFSAVKEDIKAGFIKLLRQQWQALRVLRPRITYTVAVGDIYALYLAFRFCPKPLVFVPTAKSDHIRSHLAIERYLMRKHCQLVLTRDQITATNLSAASIPAKYVGNLMMDAIFPTGRGFPTLSGRKIVGILPGSREEAYLNLPLISKMMDIIAAGSPDIGLAVALAGNISLARTADILYEQGWRTADAPTPSAKSDREMLFIKGSVPLLLAQGRFGDVLEQSSVCVGLAGTANEQAAGMGKPVVAFPGPGAQYTEKFMLMQKRLLGNALWTAKAPEDAGRAVLAILSDPKKHAEMARVGQERMGEPRGSERMADVLLDLWQETGL
ncbi:MAG: hypothetical protein GX316_06720 [Firmicutes bacterium]|nr:hypothetical protein [Bacillota bacterium]